MDRAELITRFLIKGITDMFDGALEGRGKIKQFESTIQNSIEEFLLKVTEEEIPWWQATQVHIFEELLTIAHLDNAGEQSIELVRLLARLGKDLDKYLDTYESKTIAQA